MADMVQVRRGGVKRYEGPEAKIGRSQFNRSHGLKMTFNASLLTPILVDEVLPGDTFTCSLNGFARIFSPLDAPMMDNVELESFFFFCPTRLLWENWESFNGAHDEAGVQDTSYTIPVMATGVTVDHEDMEDNDVHKLAAFMGLPHGLTSASEPWNSLPFRMYIFVYNEWFRDQNLLDKRGTTTAGHEMGNGPDAHAQYGIRASNKKHDYFTSALPYLQKGTTIAAALIGHAQVSSTGAAGTEIGIYSTVASSVRALDTAAARLDMSSSSAPSNDSMYADLADPHMTDTPGIDINALRQSVAIQRLLERDARGGTRYVEMIKAHFGVTSPDYRLQRPEYLGGGRSMINVTAVANTSDTATADQGELKGVGAGVISGHSWAKSFTEHGYILGLVRARGDLTYFQGMDRLWSRSTRYDFYIPALANLGEQAILNKEIFVSNDSNDDLVFGYQERWAEYRMKQSRLVGNFTPGIAGNLGFWHLAEEFSALPVLNSQFVQDETPMARVTTVDTEDDFLLDLWFNYKCARPIPVRSIPSLIGKF